MTVADLNALNDDQVRGVLLSCCGSSRWVESMIARRPFASVERLIADANEAWQRFRHVTWPGIRGPALLAALLNALWTFREFDIIYASTRGGPAGATETLGILVYREAFESFRFGTAAAIGVLMLGTAAIFVALSMRVLRREFT